MPNRKFEGTSVFNPDLIRPPVHENNGRRTISDFYWNNHGKDIGFMENE